MNIMDLSPDEDRFMFTLGQVIRMNAALAPNGPRAGLSASPIPCAGFFTGGEGQDRNIGTVPSNLYFRVFPNPVSAMLTAQINSDSDSFLDLAVFDLIGKIVYSRKEPLEKGEHKYLLDTRTLPSGIYTVIASIGGSIYSQKFLVER